VSLWLFTVCRPWLLALPAESVLRLLLPEEAELDEGPAVVAPDACVGVLRTEEGNTPAFDLGRLLGLPDQHAAWVRLAFGPEGSRSAVALRTGPCPSVSRLVESEVHALPAQMGRGRRGVLRAAFPITAGPRLAAQADVAGVGLVLDLDRLLTPEESAWAVETA
jgi:hypothetical protein